MNDMKERGNIVDLRELKGNETIENIFKGRGHAILFEPPMDGKSDVGHWSSLIRTKKGNCIYFDSYGEKIPSKKLIKILKSNYKELQYNPKQFQSTKSSVCGRYALMCVGLNKIIPNMTILHILKFLESKPKGKSYDQFVLDLTKEV